MSPIQRMCAWVGACVGLAMGCADAPVVASERDSPPAEVAGASRAAEPPEAVAAVDTAAAEAAAPPVAENPARTPLQPAAHARFWGSPEDAPARELLAVRPGLAGRNYLTGNELTLDMFQPRLSGLGGAYVGVGSDQAYLFIGWMGAEIAWLTDYDPKVVALHQAYRALIAAAETPEALLALFEESAGARAIALIESDCGGASCAEAVKSYRGARRSVLRRLQEVRDHMRERGVPCWLTDAGQYEHVRSLVMAGRVRPMVANLLDEGAFLGLGAAARELAVPIRALYLSNAEEYWKSYSPRFRANISALPFDDSSIVLRTIVSKEQNLDYHYNVQNAASFLAWLGDARTRRVYEIVRHKRGKVKPRPPMYSETTDSPPSPG